MLATRSAKRYALLATLTGGLATAMLDGVQRAAQLNFGAAHHLLARTCMPMAEWVGAGGELLWFVRRADEVCTVAAGRILRLCPDHVQLDADQVWPGLDEGLDRLALDPDRATALRAAFSALRASRTEYFESMLMPHEQLHALVDGVTVVAAPFSATGGRRINGERSGATRGAVRLAVRGFGARQCDRRATPRLAASGSACARESACR